MFRKLAVALLFVVLFAVPAGASECQSGSIDWSDGSPRWETGDDWTEGLRTAVVGRFLWIQVGDDEATSVPLSGDESAATVCLDGTATFTHSGPVVSETENVICDCLPDEYTRFVEPDGFGPR
jgi:hypothetical protein